MLASRCERSAHIDGDLVGHNFIVSGLGPPEDEAQAQLELRRANICLRGDSFAGLPSGTRASSTFAALAAPVCPRSCLRNWQHVARNTRQMTEQNYLTSNLTAVSSGMAQG